MRIGGKRGCSELITCNAIWYWTEILVLVCYYEPGSKLVEEYAYPFVCLSASIKAKTECKKIQEEFSGMIHYDN